MAFDDVYVVSDQLTVVTDGDVIAAEATLGTRFPDGYREYVTTLGMGYCNGFARVYLPSEIVARKAEFQQMWAMFAPSRYEQGFDLLPLHRMIESIILLSTVDGDDLVFHPDTPQALYVLPRQDWHIYQGGQALDEALSWMLTPGHLAIAEHTSILTSEGQFVERLARYFEPDGEREEHAFLLQGVNYDALRAYLIALALTALGPTLCLRHLYISPDGTEGEALQLFVKEYGGEVVCDPVSADRTSIRIDVSHDAGRDTGSLRRLLAYFRHLAH